MSRCPVPLTALPTTWSAYPQIECTPCKAIALAHAGQICAHIHPARTTPAIMAPKLLAPFFVPPLGPACAAPCLCSLTKSEQLLCPPAPLDRPRPPRRQSENTFPLRYCDPNLRLYPEDILLSLRPTVANTKKSRRAVCRPQSPKPIFKPPLASALPPIPDEKTAYHCPNSRTK